MSSFNPIGTYLRIIIMGYIEWTIKLNYLVTLLLRNNNH